MKVWIGFFRDMGVVVFDPTQQRDLGHWQVRLWDAANKKVIVFSKRKIRSLIVSLRTHLEANGLETTEPKNKLTRDQTSGT